MQKNPTQITYNHEVPHVGRSCDKNTTEKLLEFLKGLLQY